LNLFNLIPEELIPELLPPKVELRGGSVANEGNVFVNDQQVCDDFWDLSDAVVACRMLG
jgi:hypothetical protein